MAFQFSTGLRNTMLDAGLGPAFDGGTCVLELRNGTQPANANTAPAGSVLATVTLPSDSFSAAASGTIAKAGTWSGTASATGTPTWFRIRTAGDAGTTNTTDKRLDGAVGSDLTLDSSTVTSGQTITVATATFTQPAS